MTDTYTSNLRFVLPATGGDSGTWGNIWNNSGCSMIEQAICGYSSVAMTDANLTLSTNNGASDQSRPAIINFTGTLSANRNITIPGVSKLYRASNNTTGGYSLIFTTGSGTTYTLPNGFAANIACDGTNVFDQITYMGNLTLGNAPSFPQVTLGGNPVSNLQAATKQYVDAAGNGTYLPLAGGNLSGALGGTSGNFSGNLTAPNFVGNCTGNAATSSKWVSAITIGLSGNVTGSASMDGSGTVTIASTIGSGQVSSTMIATGAIATNLGYTPGYLGAPQNTQNGNYTLALTDQGGSVYHSSGTPHTYTIPTNASVAMPVGAVVLVRNTTSAGNVTISPAGGVTLNWVGQSSTGNRTMSANSQGLLYQESANTWTISGAGIT